MHEIEPYYQWLHYYEAARDERSPFFGREYDQFHFTQKIYNYLIHPQWDGFGSATLYMKILYVDYDLKFAVFEMLGEWNDCLHNDVMFLKRDVVDEITPHGIDKFILLTENVLNFHSGDDDYYAEWWDDIKDRGGWLTMLNTLPHVEDEMREGRLDQYVNFGGPFNEVNWRGLSPKNLLRKVEDLMKSQVRRIASEW